MDIRITPKSAPCNPLAFDLTTKPQWVLGHPNLQRAGRQATGPIASGRTSFLVEVYSMVYWLKAFQSGSTVSRVLIPKLTRSLKTHFPPTAR